MNGGSSINGISLCSTVLSADQTINSNSLANTSTMTTQQPTLEQTSVTINVISLPETTIYLFVLPFAPTLISPLFNGGISKTFQMLVLLLKLVKYC